MRHRMRLSRPGQRTAGTAACLIRRTAGPDMLQIGNECGFLAKVAVIPAQPVDYDYDRTSATFGNVTSTGIWLPPAVRADVVVDFSQYQPGDVLILYTRCTGTDVHSMTAGTICSPASRTGDGKAARRRHRPVLDRIHAPSCRSVSWPAQVRRMT